MARISTATIGVILLIVQSSLQADYSPFYPPFQEAPFGHSLFHFDVLKRAGSKCGTSCSSMGEDVCCGKKANCALDQAGNIACCPDNAVCTGTIGGSGGATITSGAAAATNSQAAPTAAPTASISHAISGTSTVANGYYPFPIIPTNFADADECSSSFSGCQAESAKCTGFVEGGGYGVTIAGAGGGVTQQGVIEPASAEAICSSLSQEACHGLQVGMCSTLGGAAQTTAAGQSFILGSSSSGAAPTPCLHMYGLGVGVAVGIARQMV